MEGGNKTPINLEAGLNITTSDMLVSLAQQSFQHNWQKYQGKFLPNSLRFEKNGWAAGWNVYNFDYNLYRVQENNLWLGPGQFNTYVKTINIYDREDGYDPLYTVYVVPENVVAVGDIVITGNTITGKVKNKPFQLTWDPVTHVLNSNTAGITVDYVINSDYSVTATVTDTAESYSYDFDLMLPSSLSGDVLSDIKYTGFSNNKHSWGQYTYDITTGLLTTPEGVTVTPTVTDNLIEFDYDSEVTDETEDVQYTLVKHYPKFQSLTVKDLANGDKMLIGTKPSEALAFDRYSGSVSPNELVARDTTDGVIIDYKLPVWAVAKLGVTRSNPTAKKCDNVTHYEIATSAEFTLDAGGVYNNIWDGQGTINITGATTGSFDRFLTGPSHRFNEIILNNRIDLGANFHWRRTKLNNQVWYQNSRQYRNIRSRNTTLMTRYLGDVYTWGAFYVNPADYVNENTAWNLYDTTNCIYTMEDISEVLTWKRISDAVNNDTGDDEDFIAGVVNLDASIIATLTGTTTDYAITDPAKTFAEAYTNGIYTLGTYETVPTSAEPFWPFSKVPKFNFKDAGGTVHTGVYWTDGTTIIDDLFDFMELVLGAQTSDTDPMNTFTTPDEACNRTRRVYKYKAGFDFDFIKQSSYSNQQDYLADKAAWNEIWNKYYPGTTSPQDVFSENDISTDPTYLNYSNIEVIEGADPKIRYVRPGVYVFGSQAVPFNCPSGLIIFEGGGYTLSANVWHHSVSKDSLYNPRYLHEGGYMVWGDDSMQLPFYFGSATSEYLVSGINSRSLREVTSRATLHSAALTVGVNYRYEQVYHPGGPDSPGYYTWEWLSDTVDPKCWLGNILISYERGTVNVRRATVNTGIDTVSTYQCYGDVNSGIVFGWPLWAHSATRLTYPEIANLNNINDADKFILAKVDTADLTNTTRIYFDRADTDKSIELYKVIESSREPDSSDGTGNFCVKLEPIGDAYLYYAPKQMDANANEVFSSFYIPGIAYGNPDSTEGNMEKLTDTPVMEIDWRPYIRDFPTNILFKFSNKNSRYSSHKFYTTSKSQLDNLNWELGDIDMETMEMPITVSTPNGEIEMTFNADTQTTVVPATVWMTDAAYNVESLLYQNTGAQLIIPLDITLAYNNNKAKFIKLSDYTLVSSDGDRCVISDGTNEITYSISQQKVLIPSSGADTRVTPGQGAQHISIDGKTFVIITAYLRAVYDGTIDANNVVTFTYKGLTFTFDFSAVTESGISVLSTDIRTPEKIRTIGKIRPEGQYQLLRQQWNTTVEVENYWWIDSKHVLELNQAFFALKRNTGELDDWNGDRFEKVYEMSRDSVLPTNIIRYFATNAYKTNLPAMFCALQEEAGAIKITIMNPRRKMEVVKTQYIQIRQRAIGDELNDTVIDSGTALFNTYNPLTAAQVLSKAEWSHTIVDHWLILGCHLGTNYDQWALVIDLTTATLTKVVQGYGYVSLHGDLTGGQIPNDYFDENRGFNSKVEPLSVLIGTDEIDYNDLDAAYEIGDVSKINNITPRVVGTSEQQWYIKQKLYGIVSHLTFDSGNFTKQLLPITNNYVATYKSPSFASSVFGDGFVQFSPFASIFSFEGAANVAWQAFMALVGYPFIYSVAPRYAQLVYLQQTFGQYAYVHYNSSKSMPEKEIGNSATNSGMSEAKKKQTDPVLSSAFTFDKQKFSQSESAELDYYASLAGILMGSFAASLQILDKKQAINEEVNMSAVNDVGRKFVDNAVANAGDMLASAIITQSKNDAGVTSVVTGLKSLDMFYSTSDQQRVYAGPGFVEHQFVADCVAQSVTDTQVEGKVQQFYFCIRALTVLQLQTTIALENAAADALDKAADATAAQMVCGTSLGGVAVGIHAAAAAMRAAVKAQEIALVEVDKVLDAICVNGITVNVDGAVSRHALSVEGKHKYGEKNEVFMWPCFGIQPGQIKYTDEWVDAGIRNTPWALSLKSTKCYNGGLMNGCNVIMRWELARYSSNKMASRAMAVANVGNNIGWNKNDGLNDFGEYGDTYRAYYMYGNVPFYQASAFGKAEERTLPDDMACIEGVCRFLPNEPFKNENIGVSDPAFAPSLIQDFMIDKSWDLAQCATYGLAQWVTVKDTKITNCPPSNMVVNDTFCGVACPYSAIEVKRGIEKAYMRPWAITPNTLALNCTGYNTILQDKLYHAFDGISYRLVSLIGSPGLNKNRQSFWYAFQINDRFKRSNICPANEMQGNFESEPVQAVDSIDKLWSLMTIASKEKGLEAGTTGEDKDAVRWAIPLFTEPVSTLPACVKTMTASTLAVSEGITCLVTVQVTDTNSAYKAPLSVDFTIGKNVYRATEEYICSVTPVEAGNIITDLIPILGLKFIGSTPTEAFFYSKSTRCYYSFSGSAITKLDMMERFRDIQKGYWDFVNQEVVMPCLMTFKRLNEEVEDKDTETDNIIIPVLSKGEVSGELPPPITTIFNDRSWYKCVSLPCGFTYQGPNRVIINRSIFCEYMERSIKNNFGKWKKMSRDKYVTHREYPEVYDNIMKDVQGVDGWTYNPFVLVTSALGQSEDTDCMFEWNITFCWPIEMDLLYGVDSYATVNIAAETMTPGGKKISDVTHVFLTKELFTRTGSYGYFSFRFQSKNGMGNRERLHIWSDQYIAISSIDCETKVGTSRRTEQLTQQQDVQKLKEL